MIEPENCKTLAEVRAGVDETDERIVSLLATRFRFMDAAARIKQSREAVRDEERKAAVLDHVGRAANAAGLPHDLIARVYDMLIEGSIAFELERFDAR